MSDNGRNVIAAMRAAAAARPDFKFEGDCFYVIVEEADDYGYAPYGPGCLVGQGLWGAGLIGPGFYKSRDNGARISRIEVDFGFDLDEVEWMTAAQDAQDGDVAVYRAREAWGRSVEIADDRIWMGGED